MKNLAYTLTAIIGIVSLSVCTKPKEGCTDPNAQNYDPLAQYNSLCVYELPQPTCDTCNNKAELNNVVIVINPLVNGESFYLFKKYEDNLQRNFEFTLFKYYVSNVLLSNPNFEKIQLTDVDLIDYDTTTYLSETRPIYDNLIQGELEAGTYKTIYFGCGVDPVFNEEYQPNNYPTDHPLNGLFTGMDWTWAAKYKFISIEGNIDSDNDETFDRPFFFHTGFSELYRQVILSTDEFEIKQGQTTYINIEMDVLKLFEGLDIATKEGQSHTSGSEQLVYSRKLQTNLANSFKFLGITYE